jgi:hypothetical protein
MVDAAGGRNSSRISADDVKAVVAAARRLPPVASAPHQEDFVRSLMITVLDFQMRTTTVERALGHAEVADLPALLAAYPDDRDGNTALAQHLWGYNLWTRAALLRRLVEFFDSIAIRDEEGLRAWAQQADFRKDFEGRVPGLGRAVFQSLVMRHGVDTVKPDVHVRRFVAAALGRPVSEEDCVEVVVRAAGALGVAPSQLDQAIWTVATA